MRLSVPGTGRFIDSSHATVLLVALGYATLGFADGGYGTSALALATIAIWTVALAGLLMRRVPAVGAAGLASGACLALLVVLSALSMVWADDAGRAFLAALRVAAYLGLLVAAIVWIPRTGPRAWLYGLAAGSTALVVGALASRFDPSILGGGDRSLGAVLSDTAGRLSYPIGYWNGLAACLAIGAIILVWANANATSRAARAVASGLLPAYGLAIYLTSSRGGFAAAVVGFVLLLARDRRRAQLLLGIALGGAGSIALVVAAHGSQDLLHALPTPSASNQGAWMAAATVACGLAVGLVRWAADSQADSFSPPALPFGRRTLIVVLAVAAGGAVALANPAARVHEFEHSGIAPVRTAPGQRSLLSAGGSGRYQFWQGALDAFASSPVHGVGAGNFQLYWNAHPRVPVPIRNAHSLYLETLAELGPLGLILVLGLVLVSAGTGWRLAGRYQGGEPAAALAVLIAGALAAAIDWTWQIPAAFAPVVIAIALLTGCPGGEAGDASPVRRSRGRLALALATVALALVAIGAGAITLASQHSLTASRAAATRDDVVGAAASARDAARLEPFSPEPPLQLALVEEKAGNFPAAREAAGDAIDLAPGDWRVWFVAGRIDAEARNYPAALRELRRAKRLTPTPLPGLSGG
jgi:hypothetical protein